MTLTAEYIASQLGKARRASGGNWTCLCPVHEMYGEHSPSFSIKDNPAAVGFPLIFQCMSAKCSSTDITRELKARGLYPGKRSTNDYGELEATHIYQNKEGENHIRVERRRKEDGSKNMPQARWDSEAAAWKTDGLKHVMPVLYRLPKVIEAAQQGDFIYIAEGELKVETLEKWGLVATCSSMGAGKWKLKGKYEYEKDLEGAGMVCILPDNDEKGAAHAEEVAYWVHSVGVPVKVVVLPGLPEKGDIVDWVKAGHTFEEFKALVHDTPYWTAKADVAPSAPAEETIDQDDDSNKSDWEKILDLLQVGPAPFTDVANGRRFLKQHGKKVRFTPEAQWMVWNSKCWEIDSKDLKVAELAKQTANSIFDEAERAKEIWPKMSKRIKSFAISCHESKRLSPMLKMARSDSSIRTDLVAFDHQPYLLNCKNGVVDLRTGDLLPHNPDYLFTRSVPYDFDLSAEAPTWYEFLSKSCGGDSKLMSYLMKAVGYSLTGITNEQVFWMLYGPGGNGKSIFLSVLLNLAGTFGRSVPSQMFMHNKQETQTNSPAQLWGHRVITVSEINENDKLNEAFIKDVVGGTDKITARFLFKEPFDFHPVCKLWFRGNFVPIIKDPTESIWRRIKLIPFNAVISKEEIDRDLPEKLEKEMPGILAWAVMGSMAYFNAGELDTADKVMTATEDYRKDMDSIGAFLAECCWYGDEAECHSKDIYAVYRHYCEDYGFHAYAPVRFGMQMAQRKELREKKEMRDGKLYKGIGIKTEYQSIANNEKGQLRIMEGYRTDDKQKSSSRYARHYVDRD